MQLSSISLAITRLGQQQPPWTPATLFGNGEVGVWYDPSDFSTMFQDASGTTPVTAVEQPVGLILDKSKGLVLGAELVAPIDFAVGYTASGAVVTVDSATSFTAAGVANYYKPYFTVGKWYKLTATITFSSPAVNLYNASSALNPINSLTITSGVSITYYFLAAATQLNFRPSAAGTVTVTNISVRELPGNHATQATSTKRPVLSARVNRLTKTEDFSDAAWDKTSVIVSTHTIADPEGGFTAATITANSATSYFFYNSTTNPTNGTAVNRFWVRRRTGTGAFSVRTNATGIDTPQTITPEWTQLSVNCAVGLATHNLFVLKLSTIGDAVDIWHPELIQLDQASLPYQRVNTATDYDTVGFKHYLKFDGVDDALATGSIDFTATDKMTVVAGVRKLSDAATAVLYELSDISGNGWFNVAAPAGAGAQKYYFGSKGTVLTSASTTSISYNAPNTGVITGIASIGTDVCTLRINGTQAATSATDQGTGNYGNYPLFVGSRAGTSLPFNGHLYQLIVRAAQSTDAQIVSAETYVNGKTGVTL